MSYATPRTAEEQKTRELADAYMEYAEKTHGMASRNERLIVELFIAEYTMSLSFERIMKHVDNNRARPIGSAELQDLLTRMARRKFLRRRKSTGQMCRDTKFYEVNF